MRRQCFLHLMFEIIRRQCLLHLMFEIIRRQCLLHLMFEIIDDKVTTTCPCKLNCECGSEDSIPDLHSFSAPVFLPYLHCRPQLCASAVYWGRREPSPVKGEGWRGLEEGLGEGDGVGAGQLVSFLSQTATF